MVRSYDEEVKFLERLSPCSWRIKKGFVPNMKVCHIMRFNVDEFFLQI